MSIKQMSTWGESSVSLADNGGADKGGSSHERRGAESCGLLRDLMMERCLAWHRLYLAVYDLLRASETLHHLQRRYTIYTRGEHGTDCTWQYTTSFELRRRYTTYGGATPSTLEARC
ncbi:hypothetical protein J6590_042886 [Homalodisca vitripennis]|nr:hypothetical protein J6590_042886 [Homalodisca vitripennis]